MRNFLDSMVVDKFWVESWDHQRSQQAQTREIMYFVCASTCRSNSSELVGYKPCLSLRGGACHGSSLPPVWAVAGGSNPEGKKCK
jgi:hypothetical protein